MTSANYFYYLNQSGTYKVDGTDDKKEFNDTMVSNQTLFELKLVKIHAYLPKIGGIYPLTSDLSHCVSLTSNIQS